MAVRGRRATGSRVSEVSVRRNPLLVSQKGIVGGIAEGTAVAAVGISLQGSEDTVV